MPRRAVLSLLAAQTRCQGSCSLIHPGRMARQRIRTIGNPTDNGFHHFLPGAASRSPMVPISGWGRWLAAETVTPAMTRAKGGQEDKLEQIGPDHR